MSEFKKGQLVAVSSGTLVNRRIRIFCGCYKTFDGEIMYLCREAGESEKDAVAWPRCVPLEEVEPNAFVGWDRNAGERAADAVAMESEPVQRLRRQIEWLCREFNQINGGFDEMCHCPNSELLFTPKPMDCHPEECARCWEQASLKAVEGKTCPQ